MNVPKHNSTHPPNLVTIVTMKKANKHALATTVDELTINNENETATPQVKLICP